MNDYRCLRTKKPEFRRKVDTTSKKYTHRKSTQEKDKIC